MSNTQKKKGIENVGKGLAKQAEGKIQNALGALTGNASEQVKGKAKDLAGKAQRKLGEMQADSADDTDL